MREVDGEELSGRDFVVGTHQAPQFRSQSFGERSYEAKMDWIYRDHCGPRGQGPRTVPWMAQCSGCLARCMGVQCLWASGTGSSEVPHRVTLKAGHLRGVEEHGWRLPDSLDGFAGDRKPCINSEEGAREGCLIPAHAVTPLTTGL